MADGMDLIIYVKAQGMPFNGTIKSSVLQTNLPKLVFRFVRRSWKQIFWSNVRSTWAFFTSLERCALTSGISRVSTMPRIDSRYLKSR